MIKKTITAIALVAALAAAAQERDGQLRLTPSIDYRINKKWKVGIDYRYSLDHDMSAFRSSMVQGYGQYKLTKRWAIEAGYRFTTAYEKDMHRLFTSLLYDRKAKDFTFSSRTRYQYSTQRFNSDFMEDFPPKEYLREKVGVDYNIPKCKLSVSAGAEFFFDWDRGDGFQFDRVRYIAGTDYNMKYGNSVGLSFFYEDRYTTIKKDRYVFNLKYSLALDELLKKLKKGKDKGEENKEN